MTARHASMKLFILGLSGTVVPYLAFAVNPPAGVSLEQVDTTFLGTGQDEMPVPEKAALTQNWVVQVGAYADKDGAEAQLARIARLTPNELLHAAPVVTALDWGDGRVLYRARFAGFSEPDAHALCATLIHLGESCFTIADEAAGPDGNGVIEAVAGATRGDVDPASLVASAGDRRRAHPDSSRLVSDDELSDMRGGFFTAAGAEFDFGASVQAMVNGQLALQTNLQWTSAGSVVTQLSGLGTSIQAQVATDLAKAGIAAPPTGNTALAGNAPQTASAGPAISTSPTGDHGGSVAAAFVANAAPKVLSNSPVSPGLPTTGDTPSTTGNATPNVLTGVRIQSPSGGSTQVFANVSAGQIQNIILNSASNQTIAQNTNVTLTIYNFPAWQQQLAQHALSAQLANEILAASTLGGR